MAADLNKPETAGAHTPGPWFTDSGPYPEKLHIRRADAASPTLIAHVSRVSGDDYIANAHLIAAAPDLKAVADSIVIYQVDGDDEHVRMRVCGQDVIIHKVSTAEGIALLKFEAERRSAIAKATGGA